MMACSPTTRFWALMFLASAAVFFAFLALHPYLRMLLDSVQNMPLSYGPLVFGLMFILVSLPMTWGYIILNLAAGYIWGFWIGMAVMLYGGNLGGCTAFLLCKLFFRDFVHRRIGDNEQMKAIIKVVEGKHGFKIVLLTRLSPIPFGLQNGLFSVTHISFLKYSAATAVGLLPTMALNTYMGTSLHTMEEVFNGNSNMDATSAALFGSQLIIGVGLMVFVYKKARQEFDDMLADSQRRSYDDLLGEAENGGGGGSDGGGSGGSDDSDHGTANLVRELSREGRQSRAMSEAPLGLAQATVDVDGAVTVELRGVE